MSGALGAGSQLVIPPDIANRVAKALGETNADKTFAQVDAIAGGCIHPSARICTRSGSQVFLKWGPTPGRGGFGVEAASLAAISQTGGPRVPEVLAYEAGGPELRGWILLEFIESGLPTPRTPRLLGSGLARLHRRLDESRPGWEEDGFIGSLAQSNGADQATWPEFWQKKRLQPQWALAELYFDDETRLAWDRLIERIEPPLSVWEEDGLSLLHWGSLERKRAHRLGGRAGPRGSSGVSGTPRSRSRNDGALRWFQLRRDGAVPAGGPPSQRL